MNLTLFNNIIQKHGFAPLLFNKINFPGNQYVQHKTKKKTFIIHYSSGWDNARGMFNGWAKDKLGRVCTAYGIEDSGKVYRAFDASDNYGFAIYINSRHNHLPKTLQKYKTVRHDLSLNSQAIQVEVCNWGWLKEKNNKFYSYTGVEVSAEKTVYYPNAYRGQEIYERITENEIKALQTLIMYHAINDDLRLTYNSDMWDISERAIRGAEGIWSHTSYRTDKNDIHPQAELVSMLMRVKDDFNRIFKSKDIKLLKAAKMSSKNYKYKTVEQLAMNDITKYNRNYYKNKPKMFFAENVVTAKHVFTKENRRLNRLLGLHLVNKTKMI